MSLVGKATDQGATGLDLTVRAIPLNMMRDGSRQTT
jgi:hypothetical protein